MAYQNACEAHRFARSQGLNPARMVIHGFSQGGPMAAHLAALCPETSMLVLDHSYSRIEDMMTKEVAIPKWLIKIINRASYAQHELTYNGRSIKTSAWNTEYALKRIAKTTRVFVIQSDDRMPSTHSLATIRPDLTCYHIKDARHTAYIDSGGESLLNRLLPQHTFFGLT